MTGPVAKAQLVIRKPVAQVFEAFTDPAITTHFWFSKSSGKVVPGAKLRWDWEMYGVGANVSVKAVEPNKRILVEWGGPENPTEVEWTFDSRGADRTRVAVENRGFKGSPEAQMAAALDSMGGFTSLLAGAKFWLEHGIEPRLVIDHHPEALVEGWKNR
ncbi:MAG TPA: SRPBCC family protein [Myxococcaceae bacterium]|jgi:uncharacterized protein YndB with AHSA1/START domain